MPPQCITPVFLRRTGLLLCLRLFFSCLPLLVPGQVQADPWADQVVRVNYGTGAGFGQDHFPHNVLGPPDSSATPTQPAASPAEILCLGSGGEIVLAFLEGGITDGPGVDLTIFENPFLIGGDTTAVFRETGFVAVSQDGQSWLEFPWDPVTLVGLAGVTPTNGGADPLDPAVSGGDSFDLNQLGLSWAAYLRITDSAGQVADGGDSFDLDAAVALHAVQSGSTTLQPVKISIQPNPSVDNASVVLQLFQPGLVRVAVLDLQGVTRALLVQDNLPFGSLSIPWQTSLPAGIYFIRVQTPVGIVTAKAIRL